LKLKHIWIILIKSTDCLTNGFVVAAKDIKHYSIPSIDLMKSPLFNKNQKDSKTKNLYFLIVYSVSPGLIKITGKETYSRSIEKLFVKTKSNKENELLSIAKILGEVHVIHSTGFCQIADKLMYEAYCEVTDKLETIKLQLQAFTKNIEDIQLTWSVVPMKKRNFFGVLV
jgi:hypothetical protein